MSKNLISFLMLILAFSQAAAGDLCKTASTKHVDISIDTNHVVRSSVPNEIFGFNVPWYAFQVGLQVDGEPKRDLIEWLKPFQGALYRYPGGAPTSWFEWENSIKPIAERKLVHYEYGKFAIPEFGYDEFLKFVKKVDGRAIVSLNLVGPYKKVSTTNEIAGDAARFVDWMLQKSSVRCIGSGSCPISYLELDNELDWTPYNWSSKYYADRANAVITAVGNKVPSKVWIVGGKTAPWEKNKEDFKTFNRTLSENLPVEIENIAYHPYYDGISVPGVIDYLGSYYTVFNKQRRHASVIVTEHARWPSTPPSGVWKERWFEATGQGGAISSSDFVLALIPDSKVGGATWHSLGVLGPWQLIRWDKGNNSLYPSPVYWGFRVLREGFLDDAIEVTPNTIIEGSYSGGYDVRFVAMKSKERISLLGVNRSKNPLLVNIRWVGNSPKNVNAIMRYTSAPVDSDNVDMNKSRVVMLTSLLKRATDGYKSTVCISGHSVFSIVY